MGLHGATTMHGHSMGLVFLSVMVAIVGGYVALGFAQRSARAPSLRERRRWLLLASAAMGLGIWSMHFIGMLALNLDFPVRYEPVLVALSMFAAVLGAGIGLHVITRKEAGMRSVFAGAAFMGFAVGAMHYIGMASMQMPARIEWNVPLVILSLAIAYGASFLALGLIFRLHSGQQWTAGPLAAAAVAVGVGVAGLHYTGMAAASFYEVMDGSAATGASTDLIAVLLGVAAAVMLIVLLAGVNLDARRGAIAQDLTIVAEMMRDVLRSENARESICLAACDLTDADYAALLEPGPGGELFRSASHGSELIQHDVGDAKDAYLDGHRRFRPGEDGGQSTLYEPILLDARRIGVLFVVWPSRVKRLTDRAVTIAGLLATEAAFAIDRADLLGRLERQASTDELTGLPNRRSVQAELDRQLEVKPSGRPPLSVAMLDIDHFKSYNDRFGHQGGDRLLEAVSRAWMQQLRGGDFAGRYGGEEFLVVLPRCALESAAETADRLRTAVPGEVTCSAGVATWDGSETADALIARADRALYAAKSRGRDRTEAASEGLPARPSGGRAPAPPDPTRSADAADWFASEASLRSVIDVVADALVMLDVDGMVLGWNNVAETLFGWTPEEAAGKDLGELLGSRELSSEREAVLARLRGDAGAEPFSTPHELQVHGRDGAEVPVELRLSVVDAGGRPYVIAFMRDTTERRATEVQLKRFASIVASSDDAIMSGSTDGRIQTWNPAAERIYGYSEAEMIGEDIGRLRPHGEAREADIERRRAVQDGRTVSLEVKEQRRDGSMIDVSATITPLHDDAGRTVGFGVIGRDVTEQKAAAAHLAQTQAQSEDAFEAATIGMATVAPDGRLLSVNPALCDFLKRDRDTLLASTFQKLTHPDDLEADLEQFQHALAGEIDGYRISKRYLLPDGGIVWGLLTVTVVRGPDGSAAHFVSQIQDIADRKTAEGEMRRYARHLEILSNQDPLTGLANRRAFNASLAEELSVLAAGGSPCSLLLIAVSGDDAEVTTAARSVVDSGRDENLAAHLGAGEIAVLLPGVDEGNAAGILDRTAEGLDGLASVRCAGATAQAGDQPGSLLARAREALGPLIGPTGPETNAPGHVRRLLELARSQLGMPLSFLTRLDGDEYVFERIAGDEDAFGIGEGLAMPLDGSHCVRMLDGRIGSAVHDLAAEPETRDLEITRSLGLRAYAGVPVHLRSGELYGTLCAIDTKPHPELTETQLDLLRFVSALTAELIDAASDEQAARLAATSATGVRTLLVALEARDFYTGEHSKRVVGLASAVARRLELDEEQVRDVEQVALLHDVGKVGIPDAILQKQGPLDEQEWELMRQHPVVGERIIVGTPGLSHLAPAMRAEHERWDGAGYPDGLAGEEIPLASRITLACDAFHAMTSDRPYRPSMSLERAREELRSYAGTQFDPNVAEALLAELASQLATTTL